MRVTKTIREYITKRVREKYQPRIAEIDRDYKAKKKELNEEIECARLEFEKQLQTLVKINCGAWHFESQSWGGGKDILSCHEVKDKDAEHEHYQLKRKIEEEMFAVIDNIVVELELGGNKEALEKMLSEI